MYLSISSADIPIPLSEMVIVFASLSSLTKTCGVSPLNAVTSPDFEIVLRFIVASAAFETSSLRKISWSL